MARDPIAELAEARRAGRAQGLCSVCSSHPLVLEAALRRVARTGAPLLVEATANQVNQQGGYSGATPEQFAARLDLRCAAAGVDPSLVPFGGDHLGPYPWRRLPAREAMARAEVLVRRFVRAGARKIHLDASMPLGGDPPGALGARTAVERAARLCAAAEDELAKTRAARPEAPAPYYVVGTEVPVPGGCAGGPAGGSAGPVPTRPEDLRTVLEMHRSALEAGGLGGVWERVIAVVVQPGVEFGAAVVHGYRPGSAEPLRKVLEAYPGLLLEGHSTDYQSDAALRALVRDGVALLKVGPALTFALREALFGMCFLARELHGRRDDDLVDTVLAAMRAHPQHWKGYYAEGPGLDALLAYGYSDRIRYYWDRAEVAAAVRSLFDDLRGRELLPGLLRQHLPGVAEPAGVARLRNDPEGVAIDAVDRELGRYERACGPS